MTVPMLAFPLCTKVQTVPVCTEFWCLLRDECVQTLDRTRDVCGNGDEPAFALL